jgi:hypothetical protein
MKKSILVLLLVVFCGKISYAQNPQTTGGCEDVGGMSMNATSVLTNGVAYSIDVWLEDEMQPCRGDINIKLGDLVIGKVSDVIRGTFTIPLDKFNLPAGQYPLEYTFSSTYSNHGIMAIDTVTVVGATGIAEVRQQYGINIYPMPANDVLYIDIAGRRENIIGVKLLDMSGREVRALDPSPGNAVIPIPVSDIPAGMYVLKLQLADGVLNEKIVVSH